MKRKKYMIITILAALVLGLAGAAVWFLLSVPPGEEWISYGSEELIASIDLQLEGADVDRLAADQANFVQEKLSLIHI